MGNPDSGWNAMHRQRLRGGAYEPVSRNELFARDRGVCHVCGGAVDPNGWHADHLTAIAAGGDHTMANMAVAHPVCNMRRGMAGMAAAPRIPGRPRVRAFCLTDNDAATLDGISDKRYQGNRSAALRFGMLLLERVAGDPSTATVDPANIDALLDAYCEGRTR